jgi:hypothetical protein
MDSKLTNGLKELGNNITEMIYCIKPDNTIIINKIKRFYLRRYFIIWKYFKTIETDEIYVTILDEHDNASYSADDSSINDDDENASSNSIDEIHTQYAEIPIQEINNKNEIVKRYPTVTETNKLYLNYKRKKLSFSAVEKQINSYYYDDVHSLSSALDILASYLKGQKIIYMHSKILCEQQLNQLMIPSIILTAIASVATELVDCSNLTRGILSLINAVVGCLLAFVNYSRYEAAAEAHKITAHQYDKLQSTVEFTSGTILLFKTTDKNIEKTTDKNATCNLKDDDDDDDDDDVDKKKEVFLSVRKKILSVERKIIDIKQSNQFLVPQYICSNLPVIYNTNIFSLIKKIDDQKIKIIIALKNIKNELRYVSEIQKSKHLNNEVMTQSYKYRILVLFDNKKKCMSQLLLLKSAYSMVDQMFNQEIENSAISKRRFWLHLFRSVKYVSYEEFNNYNPSYNPFSPLIYLDPVKLNPFLDNLIDPFKDGDSTANSRKQLDTLWAQAGEIEWVSAV